MKIDTVIQGDCREILKTLPETRFGQKSGKKSGTNWMCFMEEPDE